MFGSNSSTPSYSTPPQRGSSSGETANKVFGGVPWSGGSGGGGGERWVGTVRAV